MTITFRSIVLATIPVLNGGMFAWACIALRRAGAGSRTGEAMTIGWLAYSLLRLIVVIWLPEFAQGPWLVFTALPLLGTAAIYAHSVSRRDRARELARQEGTAPDAQTQP